MYNTSIDTDNLANLYKQDNRLRIANIFDPAYAEEIAKILEEETAYAALMNVNGENRVMTREDLEALTRDEKRTLQNQLLQEASRGIGFYYNGHQMTKTKNAKLQAILEFLNHPHSLALIRKITGADDLVSVDGQATQYVSGHYLTRHNDNIEGDKRRIAYVYGFTRQWHPDWGGLLQFFEPDGTPRNSWVPGFNTLSIFDVRHIHSVTYVAPFAGAKRHSITGWYRTA